MRRVLWLGCIAFVCLLAAASALAAPHWCLAELECWDGSLIQCVGRMCQAVPSDCSVWQAGWIACDGTATSCPACPPLVASLEPSGEAPARRAGADEGAVSAALAQ